jgi:hypothetical protein
VPTPTDATEDTEQRAQAAGAEPSPKHGGRRRRRRRRERERERGESASAIIFAPSFLPFLLFLNYLFAVHCWTPNLSVAAVVVDFLETDKEHFVLLLSSSKFGS